MNNRLWNLEKDYDTLVKWWDQHDFDLPVPKDVLPPLGIIIEEDNVSICAAGLYEDYKRTKFGFMFGDLFVLCHTHNREKGPMLQKYLML